MRKFIFISKNVQGRNIPGDTNEKLRVVFEARIQAIFHSQKKILKLTNYVGKTTVVSNEKKKIVWPLCSRRIRKDEIAQYTLNKEYSFVKMIYS